MKNMTNAIVYYEKAITVRKETNSNLFISKTGQETSCALLDVSHIKDFNSFLLDYCFVGHP